MEFTISPKYFSQINRFFKTMVGGLIAGTGQYSLYFLYNAALFVGTLAAGLLLLKTPPDSTTVDFKSNA